MECYPRIIPYPPTFDETPDPEKLSYEEIQDLLALYAQDEEALRNILTGFNMAERHHAFYEFFYHRNTMALFVTLEFMDCVPLPKRDIHTMFAKSFRDDRERIRLFVTRLDLHQKNDILSFAFGTGKVEQIASVLECLDDAEIFRSEFLFLVSTAILRSQSDVMHFSYSLPFAPTPEESSHLLWAAVHAKNVEDFRFLIARGADPDVLFRDSSRYHDIFNDLDTTFLNEFVVAGTNFDVPCSPFEHCVIYRKKAAAAALFNLGFADDMNYLPELKSTRYDMVTFLKRVNEDVNEGDRLRGEEPTDRFIRYYLLRCPPACSYAKTLFDTLETEKRTLTEGTWELWKSMRNQFVELPCPSIPRV